MTGPVESQTVAPHDPRGSTRRAWWGWFVAALLLVGAWSLATPLFAAPDEGGHVRKAAAVATGQLRGSEVPSLFSYATRMRVPRALIDLDLPTTAGCFEAHPTVTPRCVHVPKARPGTVRIAQVQGYYPPLYYLIVGGPTRLHISPVARVWAVRGISVVVAAAFLASAFASAARLGRIALLGVAAAITPMVAYLSSVVNPSGLEIASAIALWATCLALARAQSVDSRLVARAALAWLVAVNTRTLTLPMAGVAVLTLVALSDRTRLREVVAPGWRRAWVAVAAVSTVPAVAWGATLGRVPPVHHLAHVDFTFMDGVRRTWQVFEQSVAWFGLFEVRVPVAIVLWLAFWAALVAVALAVGRRRERVVLVGVVLIGVLVPIVISMIQPPPILFAWQGRYSLALWAGAPIVAASVAATVRLTQRAVRYATATGVVVFALAQLVAFAAAARRYTVGVRGPVLYLFHATWTGPLAPAAVLGLAAAGIGAISCLCVRAPVGSQRRGNGRVRGSDTLDDGIDETGSVLVATDG